MSAPRGQGTIRGQPTIPATAAAHQRQHPASALLLLAELDCSADVAEPERAVLWAPISGAAASDRVIESLGARCANGTGHLAADLCRPCRCGCRRPACMPYILLLWVCQSLMIITVIMDRKASRRLLNI